MRAYFSTGWIFRGWIYCLIFALCIQRKHARPTCTDLQYLQGNKCCSKCKPGTYLSASCTENEDTKCRPCGKNEYQAKYNTEKRCYPQKFCDEGKGFYRPTPSSTTELEPCQCKEGFQCTTSYCEFCDRIKPCPPGQGLAGETGKRECKDCDYGFFSDSSSVEACKKWTDCKAIGKSEEKPGSEVADAVCGPPIREPSPPWAVVAIPCAIIVMCAVILSYYKDKLNILSVNLRTCVQNIKQSRIQQETLTPPYHSNRPLYEITSQVDEGTPEYLSMCSKSARDSPGLDQAQGNKKTPYSLEKDRADGSSGSSAEGSESPCSPHPGSSCSCLIMKEPVEVGENEDCSELVATGLAGCCSCAQVENVVPGPRKDDNASLKEPPLCGNFYTENVPGCLQGSQELYLDYRSAAGKEEVMSEVRDLHSDTSAYERNEPQCCSIESTAVLSSLSTSNNQGLSLISSADNNQPKADADLEIQSQSSDTALTCAQVTGNNNTTFISTGQVMNFTGDVIMVYVSQTSLGSSGDEEPYASPVQEQSAECANQNVPKSYQRTEAYERQIPVQEMTNRRLQRNQNLSV